ncbi:MAG: hypothetical protein ACJA1C_002354 [Crocinitomicaceae bacterium]|jgi:hypothetical protein
MSTNLELTRFRTELLQELKDSIIEDNEGGIKEEKFTELALEYLEESGETEGTRPCREIKENSIGNRIHKISGYAISEGYETIDLFITVYKGTTELKRLYSEELKGAAKLSTKFAQNLLNGKIEGIEETAPVFDFTKTIQKIASDIVRINIYIISDVLIPLTPPESSEIGNIIIQYHIRDIEYLHRIHASGTGKQSIEIDFNQGFGETIPCLSTPKENEDYESYLAVVPARILADIYRDYGSRLLEQNVRTFLQFRGNINKGIRDTILKEPHMFMAYNNGISATAESVELTKDKSGILSIKDFQVVNGGQTTASIFQTRRKFKDADIDSVCVQLKLTVISDPLKKADIISRISRYANTQNKVSEADLTSNHPFHIDVETYSRKMWAPGINNGIQTRWFYERARGQYNDELSKIDALGQRKKWLGRNPKNQKFAKEDLARFYNAWDMNPWWVVRGRQKNFVEFMKVADEIETDQFFYEDLVAKAIIFRTAEKLYGRGANAIGDLRYMVVPYTIAKLNQLTVGKINLSKIWQHQAISEEFGTALLSVLIEVNEFMKDTAPSGLIGEWAKKEDCWKLLKETKLETNISVLNPELYSNEELAERNKASLEIEDDQRLLLEKKVKDIGADGWLKIDQWGKATNRFDTLESNFIWKIVRKIENKKEFLDKDLTRAIELLDTVSSESPKLLKDFSGK